MHLGLSGKRALVLSASRGLGLAIAKGLAAEGADVLIVGRDVAKLAAESDAIDAAGAGRAFYLSADLTSHAGVSDIIASAEATFRGGVDILVNNTGGPPPEAAAEVTPGDLRAQLEAMVLPLTEITRHVLPGMRNRGWGRVITVTSWGVVEPIPNLAVSNAMRAALAAWSKTLAGEVAGEGVTVNVLVPGRFATDRHAWLDEVAANKSGKSIEEIVRANSATIPVGRYGTVEEFAATAAFLASVPAAYITGSLIRVDGGMLRSI